MEIDLNPESEIRRSEVLNSTEKCFCPYFEKKHLPPDSTQGAAAVRPVAPAPPRAPPPHPPRAAAPIRGIAASAPRYPCGGHFPCHLFRISLLHATWEGPVHKHSACVAVNPCATSAGTGRLCCIHLQLSPPILKPALHARTSRSLQLVACALPPLRSISRAPPPSRSGDAAQTSSALRLPTAAVF